MALRVSVSYVSKVLSRRNKTGETTARPQRCHLTPRLADLHQAIRRQVATRPDATIADLEHGRSETAVARADANAGLRSARNAGD